MSVAVGLHWSDAEVGGQYVSENITLTFSQYDMIWYICQMQLGYHPLAVVQYTFTHKQYIEQYKTNNT